MGIRFTCPNGHKLHVKAFLAGKRGVCPQCGAKILIPAEEPDLPHVAPITPQPKQTKPVSSDATIGAPSILIAVADSTIAKSPAIDFAHSVTQPLVQTAPPAAQSPPAPSARLEPPIITTIAEPLVVATSVEPISPAVRYVAQRERSKRNQIFFAVLLLLAVIVLAGVLIYVLLRGANPAPAKGTHLKQMFNLTIGRQAVLLIDRSFYARSALSANE